MLLRYVVVVTTPQLWESKHTPYQAELAATVIDLRDRARLQFPEIAELLTRRGLTSISGKPLFAKDVFSIFKKWTARAGRNSRSVSMQLRDVWIET